MAELKICRVCLIQNVKMYKYPKEYDEIVNITVKDSTRGMPQWFCYECTTMLLKFYNFKQKCYRGLSLLKELLKKEPLSLDAINQIDRQTKGLESSIQIATKSNLRVKTYTFKYGGPTVISGSNFNINQKEVKTKNSSTKKKLPLQLNECRKKPIDFVKMKTDAVFRMINFNQEIVCDNNSEIDTEDRAIMSDNLNVSHKANKEVTIILQKRNFTEINKFKRSIKKKMLNPKHWKRFSLTDEEADKEFKAKKVNQKYLKANFKCSDCFRVFSQEEMLKRHLKIKHCRSLGSFQCRFCHMRVKWKSRLQKHLKEHYIRYKCLRCELCFSVEETAFKHDEFHNGVTRTCQHCGEQFRHLSSFYTHLRKHRSKFVCTLCGISFLSEFGLYMHKKVKHIFIANTETSESEETQFCEVCDIKFETQKAYEEHLSQSAMHTQVTSEEDCISQPLKWRYTDRRAPRKYTNCSTCGQNFSTYVAYSKHHLTEHPNLPLTANPQKPMRKICEVCGMSVAPMSLTAHINTHTREKRHTCNTCGTQLSSKSGLNRHRMIHEAGEKPNKCNLCDISFTQITSKKLHFRTVHNMKEPCGK